MALNPFKRSLTSARIAELLAKVKRCADEDGHAAAFAAAQPLVQASPQQREAAFALVVLFNAGHFGFDNTDEVVAAVLDHQPSDRALLADLGAAASSARDWRYLNDAPPQLGTLERLARSLESALAGGVDEHTRHLHYGLATVCRVLGRQWDELAERSYRAARDAQPDRWQLHYDLGLFYKTRGRFAEGMAANERAYALGARSEDVLWNLGICATGSRCADVALKIWKDLGQKIEIGRFGLPEGGYASTKVRLAERPLAERRADEDASGPGLEETIWIERLSPCHGIIRSVLFQDLGVDFGDLVIFDGAPITQHKYGDSSVPVFPHLATLERREYQFFNFAGTQSRQREIAELSELLPEDAVVYSHTEQFKTICQNCWENPEADHRHGTDREHHVVLGQIAAPPGLDPSDLQETLDAVLKGQDTIRFMAPGLADAAGDPERAAVERRRYDMLVSGLED